MIKLWQILVAGAACGLATPIARAESELVVAIRYLQAQGTSHSHLFLFREDGKLLRQLTTDNSGQDFDPIFAADGSTIVFTREKSDDKKEFWSVEPRGQNLKKLDGAPDWYASAKSSPFFTNFDREQSESPASPTPDASASASATTSPESTEQPEDRPPENIKAPDGSGEIFWKKGEDKTDPLDWVMWFRDKSGTETKIDKLPGFPSFEPLHELQNKDRLFLFDGSLRFTFFESHLNSSDGDTVLAFDFNKPRLTNLSPNWATPIPLPGQNAFLTLTTNRYVPIPGSSKTANCSYMERWDEKLNKVRYAKEKSAAICYGMSIYRPGKDPAVITMRRTAD